MILRKCKAYSSQWVDRLVASLALAHCGGAAPHPLLQELLVGPDLGRQRAARTMRNPSPGRAHVEQTAQGRYWIFITEKLPEPVLAYD
jgi:hypothetical protein